MSLTASTVHRGNSLSQMVELTSARLLREFSLHSPQHGGVGIMFPIATPRGCSSKAVRRQFEGRLRM